MDGCRIVHYAKGLCKFHYDALSALKRAEELESLFPVPAYDRTD